MIKLLALRHRASKLFDWGQEVEPDHQEEKCHQEAELEPVKIKEEREQFQREKNF